ncbi:MAG TPA: 4Fe-4S binding protein [Victivallales bacterium]|nr:4Fe-4S binding protein [Victivallales bacterium]HRR06032.1 4Fe-4S binding protein [Victivallales bacterium]HRR28992.1 4Fe-4S binding protein [Victivallales bacterium]HRU01555.1 4Fe-4S binding protein [Victivallales bacterium]
MKRKIIKINEDKCTGCGICVNKCAEGAIQIVNGKAKLISESYCDGLGACIGECPYDAITIEEREAIPFNEEEVKKHLAKKVDEQKQSGVLKFHGGCPGMKAFSFKNSSEIKNKDNSERKILSELSQWPIQLHLVPVKAPYWDKSDIILAADCTAFSFGDFHQQFLKGKKLIIACPKLDNTENYTEKLSAILSENDVNSLTVLRMEVPCCGGIAIFAREAKLISGKDIPLKIVIIGIDGSIKSINME